MNEDPNKIIARVARDSAVIGQSAIERTAKDTIAQNDTQDDIERLGRKIGRSLGWIAVVVLIVLLANDLMHHFGQYF